MPVRKIQLAEGEIYHVFNRSLYRQPVFLTTGDYHRFVLSLYLLMPVNHVISPSDYFKLHPKRRKEILKAIDLIPKLVEVYAYCLMPNHFHILLRQLVKNGISKLLSDLQNSYTRYFNLKHEKKGQLFVLPFKSVLIETTEQFNHVARYIHLNPYTGYVCKSIEDLLTYPWSSLGEYLSELVQGDNLPRFCKTDEILGLFDHDRNKFWEYVQDRADYQRELKAIEHLILEE